MKSDELVKNAEPDKLHDTLGALVHRLAHALEADLEAELQQLQLSVPHLLVLDALAHHDVRSQLDLGCCASINRTKMVALLDDLERLGLARRRRDPEDRRVYRVHLTAAGADRLREAARRQEAVEARLLAPLTDEERRLFRALLRRVAPQPPGETPAANDPSPSGGPS